MSEPFIGEIIYFGGNFAPRGYMQCAGQVLSIAQNAALFSILGTTYGGNGTSTFQLPDLRGRVPIGVGQGPGTSNYALGQLSGSENTTLLISNMPAHNHTATFASNGSSLGATQVKGSLQQPDNGTVLAKGNDSNAAALPQIYAPAGTATPVSLGGLNVAGTVTVAPNGGSQPFSIVQPYLTLFPLIAVQGIFPSRN